MKVTRILHAAYSEEAAKTARSLAFVRADIWRRFGALGTQHLKANGTGAAAICARIANGGSAPSGEKIVTSSGKTVAKRPAKGSGLYDRIAVDGTIRAETIKDVVNDLLTYRAAAEDKVRRSAKLTKEQRAALVSGDWLSDPQLHRLMRRHFRHGKTRVDNQFVVRSDKHCERIADGKLIVTIHRAQRAGGPFDLVCNTNGQGVDLAGANLRILVRDGRTEIHYCIDKPAGRVVGENTIGLDKGYTEAFVDSDGDYHGQGFGNVLSAYTEQRHQNGKARNKLHALEKKYRAQGKTAKADRIRANNLGRAKLDARLRRTHAKLKDLAYKAAHAIVDKAAVVVSEDLTSPIASKVQWKGYNRRMSGWAKGILARALEEVCRQRGAQHILVNAAYTSQMDSLTGRLEGRRVGDLFYRENGDVMQADFNAARNIKDRANDPDITRYMRYQEVKAILMRRSQRPELPGQGVKLGSPERQLTADYPLCTVGHR